MTNSISHNFENKNVNHHNQLTSNVTLCSYTIADKLHLLEEVCKNDGLIRKVSDDDRIEPSIFQYWQQQVEALIEACNECSCNVKWVSASPAPEHGVNMEKELKQFVND